MDSIMSNGIWEVVERPYGCKHVGCKWVFKKGLNPELRTLLIPQIYPDFNTLMNKAILTERAKIEEKKDNKC